MGLLRTILIILLVVFVIRLVARYVLPLILRSYANKAQRNFEDQMRNMQNQNKPRGKEGDVTIDYDPKKSDKRSDDSDFVDYEEVE